MKKLSVIFPARSNIAAMYNRMNNIIAMTDDHDGIEVLCAIDTDDEVFVDLKDHLEKKFAKINLKFFVVQRSEHFTKDYWNFLAKQANGRFIVVGGLDCQIMTKRWDEIIYRKMSKYADIAGDDLVHGLLKDGIKREGENALYPNFSCNPVVSKKHVEVLGYLFDERYWCWGSDQAVTYIYKMFSDILHQRRIVSITNVEILAENSMHTTKETDEAKLEIMRQLDRGYQHNLRINQEHPYTMTIEDALVEAEKLKSYVNMYKSGIGGPCGHQKRIPTL